MALVALALLAAGCDRLPGAAAPTPEAGPGQAAFTQPVYISYLKAEEYLPGSAVQYLGEVEGGYAVLIDGERAVKKTGDSLNWKGVVARGVSFDYQLRIIGVILGQFEATGPLTIVVDDVQPADSELPERADLHFDRLVINTSAQAGENFPWLTIGYAGLEESGARLTGVEGYAYREVGDSVDWQGRLRDNVWLKVNLRVSSASEDELRLFGAGEIWINR
jgi:hypothetical protein